MVSIRYIRYGAQCLRKNSYCTSGNVSIRYIRYRDR